MTQRAICPQQHVWSPGETVAGTAQLTCPVCGQAGTPAADELSATFINNESLDPNCFPPLVANVQSFTRAAGRPRTTTGEAAAPIVPGYDILRELGRGGMGVVYLAQHQELKRLVALKMILAGAHAGVEVLTRFHREAEAVARLQHPGIVQIHAVGECEGRPYIALEYVEGNNLGSQFAEATLAPNAAASLIEQLARTIHYAHQRGIVHRDLTPRNILLARSDSMLRFQQNAAEAALHQPKITDFGLAMELDDDSRQTRTGAIMGTPSYMSPEQAQGKTREIGPATDIHALGVILYEALTGRPPYLAETSYETLVQVIQHEPVPPTRLQPRVPQDLETICLKCLAKDAPKRYESAEALADDLHRFLAREPILARPVAWHERAWKWTRRHPTAAALVAVVVLAAIAFAAGGIKYYRTVRNERDLAESRLNLAMRAVDEMLSEVGEKGLADQPGMEKKRQVLLEKALALNKTFLSQKTDDPRVRLGTIQAQKRLADVLRWLGNIPGSIAAYDQALVLLSESPENAEYRYLTAYCHNWIGEDLRLLGDYANADIAYQKAQEILETLADEQLDHASYRQELARTHYNRGILLGEMKRPPEAESQFQTAISILGELPEEDAAKPECRQHLGLAYLNLGTVIPHDKRINEAQDAYDHAIAIFLRLNQQFSDSTDYQFKLGVAQNNLGNLLTRKNQWADAKAAYAKSQESLAPLARNFPKVPDYRKELANSLNSVGNVSSQEKDNAGAVKAWEQAASLFEGLIAEQPDVATNHADLGMTLVNLGVAHHALSQLPQARANLEKATDGMSQALLKNYNDAFLREVLRAGYQNLAEVLVLLHDHAAAARAARTLTELFPQAGEDRFVAACFLARCAREVESDSKLDAAARPERAKAYADDAVAMLRMAIDSGFNDVAKIEKATGSALQPISARPDFQELLAKLRNAKPGP